MSTIKEIEEAIEKLSPEERATLIDHLFNGSPKDRPIGYTDPADDDEWDKRFEADVRAGKLDWLMKEARDEMDAGRCTEL